MAIKEEHPHYMGLLVFLCVIIVVGFGWLIFAGRTPNLPPEPPMIGEVGSGNIGGLAFFPGDDIDPQYAPPWDIFNNDAMIFTFLPEQIEINPSNLDLPLDLAIEVNHPGGVVYKYAYIYLQEDGEEGWDDFRFDQDTIGDSNWIENYAGLMEEVEAGQFLEFGEGEHYVVAYSCKQHNGEWKCGCSSPGNPEDCNKWMIQSFHINISGCTPGEYDCVNNDLVFCDYDLTLDLIDNCGEYEVCNLEADVMACESTLPPEPAFCGNRMCEDGEGYYSCPQDCSALEFNYAYVQPSLIRVDENNPNMTAYLNSDVSIKNNLNYTLYNVTVQVTLDDIAQIQVIDSIQAGYVGSPEEQFNLAIPHDMETADYEVFIEARAVDNNFDEITEFTRRYVTIAQEEDIECDDHDNGLEYYNPSYVRLDVDYPEQESGDEEGVPHSIKVVRYDRYYEDTCCINCQTDSQPSGPFVREYYCNENYVQKEHYACPEGCEGGACVSGSAPVEECTDSDGGINIYTAGYCEETQGGGGSGTSDTCIYSEGGEGPDLVSECFCDGDDMEITQLECPNGCVNGACLLPVVESEGVEFSMYWGEPLGTASGDYSEEEFLEALDDHAIWDDDGTVYPYQQYVSLAGGQNIRYNLVDNDVYDAPVVYLDLDAAYDYIWTYELFFNEPADWENLDDLEELKMFGKDYLIENIFDGEEIVLLENSGYLVFEMGQGTIVEYEGEEYDISILGANQDTMSIILRINGDTESVNLGNIYTIGGLQIFVEDIFISNVGGVTASAKIYYGIRELNLGSTFNTWMDVQVDDEDLDGVEAYMTGNDSAIEVIMFRVDPTQIANEDTGEDYDWLALGDTFTNPLFGWQLKFADMEPEFTANERSYVELQSSGNDLELSFTNVEGVEYIFSPYMYDENTGANMTWGHDFGLFSAGTPIQKDSIFILMEMSVDLGPVSRIFEFMGSDLSDNEASLRDIGTGSTYTYFGRSEIANTGVYLNITADDQIILSHNTRYELYTNGATITLPDIDGSLGSPVPPYIQFTETGDWAVNAGDTFEVMLTYDTTDDEINIARPASWDGEADDDAGADYYYGLSEFGTAYKHEADENTWLELFFSPHEVWYEFAFGTPNMYTATEVVVIVGPETNASTGGGGSSGP
ncbi:hypothetical protein HQ533_00765 [Candidatus Woesearchaeota archaeon]|nr:hypothetical protein [Candidatus Woesearchaeota archaeon]